MGLERVLDGVVDEAIADGRIVGAVLIVRKNGDIVYQKAHGMADREAGRPMTLDAIFRYSSLTKPLIAATILAQADAGLLRLDDPVTAYLPDFRPRLKDGREPAITINHLLTHTAGLWNDVPLTRAERVDPRYKAVGFNRFHLPLEANVQRLVQFPLLYEPGKAWAYSQATDVLGLIASKVEGASVGTAVENRVAGPLGMADTRFGVTDRDRLAAAYADGKGAPVLMGEPHGVPNQWGGTTTFFPNRIFDPKAYQSGVGGMAGTGPDFMRFVSALADGGGAILTPERTRDGLANQTPLIRQSQLPGWKFSHFGAWLDDPRLAAVPGSHGMNRWGGIFGHSWFLDPAQGLAVVSMTNTGLEGSDGQYKNSIRDSVYAQIGSEQR